MIDIITLLLLLVIAFELGWIIFKVVKSGLKSKAPVNDVIDRLIKEQEAWTEITRDLAAKLASASEGRDLLRTPDTNGLRQLQVQTAELLTVLQELSVSISKSQSFQASVSAELSDRIADLLEQTCSRVDKSFMQVVTEIRNDRQESLRALKSQSDSQTEESKALTSLLLEMLSEIRLRSSERSSTVLGSSGIAPPPAITPTSANDPVAADSKASIKSSNLPPAVSGYSDSASLEFEKLQSWVSLNLPQIMNRSLNQWNKPEELFRGAPSENGHTARLLDPDSKLVLVGVNDASQYLVIALPGGYIDPRYYEWFNLPKGIGARVERTMTPAIVEATDLGFRVLQRGLITQD